MGEEEGYFEANGAFSDLLLAREGKIDTYEAACSELIYTVEPVSAVT